MTTVSRTVNPLHFEDLEPRRFEDLVRQLAYDFRTWRRLEATGRAGSDAGFDARGWEIVPGATNPDAGSDDESELSEDSSARESHDSDDRVWLIQCKRERRIGPSKMVGYLAEIPVVELRGLYGVLIAAPCDFSKATRDAFRTWCSSNGVADWHLWGRAEIEDLLFRPANDHLLFAYFGFSLQIRKRSVKTELRARIATKRRTTKLFGSYEHLLLRDPLDDRYPSLDAGTQWDRSKRGRWRVAQVEQIRHDGIHVLIRQSLAYLGANGCSWDYPETSHSDRSGWNLDPWLTDIERVEAAREEVEARRRWNALPDDQRGRLHIIGVLPFDAILAIDEDGDDVFGEAHVFTVEWLDDFPPYLGTIAEIRCGTRSLWNPDHADRVEIFRRNGEDWPADPQSKSVDEKQSG